MLKKHDSFEDWSRNPPGYSMNYGIPDWDYDDRRHAIIPRINFGDDEFFETEDALKLHQKEVSEMLIRILLGFANYPTSTKQTKARMSIFLITKF